MLETLLNIVSSPFYLLGMVGFVAYILVFIRKTLTYPWAWLILSIFTLFWPVTIIGALIAAIIDTIKNGPRGGATV